MTEKLLPCPFCGSKAHAYDIEASCEIRCLGDNCNGRMSSLYEDDAIAYWNRRATDTAPLYYILRRTVGKTTGHYEYWCIDGRFWSDEIYAHGCIYDKHDAEEYQRDYGGEILPIRLLVGGVES